MRIIVDAFGGDNAPLDILKGSLLAIKELNVQIILTGNKGKIIECCKKNNIDASNFEIEDAKSEISMTDEAKSVLKEKNDSSMAVGFKLLNEGAGEALVSAGNTGAITVGATFITKRLKGVKRPCIATVMPSEKSPFLLLDCGANSECRADALLQFAHIGNLYMKKIMNVENPRIALANNGTEETKGTSLQKEAYSLLKNEPLNFIGNIEGRRIPYGDADVVVADGFTGNLILKTYEGVAKVLMNGIKGVFKKNVFSMLSVIGVAGGILKMKKQFDYKEYGGAALLGVRQPVIKAHGSSDAKSFKNAIRQAVKFVDSNFIEETENLFKAEMTND